MTPRIRIEGKKKMISPLRSYQKDAIVFMLKNPRCAVWADPGMGKTRTVIEMLHLLEMMEGPQTVLVLAPLAVAKYTWPEEVKKWAPEFYCGFKDTKTYKRRTTIHCINYEFIPQWVRQFKDAWPYTVIVADEATKLKGFRLRQGSKRAQILAKTVWKKNTTRFIELSGTPAPNGLLDLWGQCWFLDRGKRLGKTFTAFSNRWFTVGYDGFTVSPTEAARREIPDRIKDLCMSISAKDHLDLPRLLYQQIPVDMPAIAFDQYKAMEKKMLANIEGEDYIAFNAASKTAKLLQMAAGAIYSETEISPGRKYQILHDAKLHALNQLIEDFPEPLIVAYWYQSDLHRLQKAFPQARTLKDDKILGDWNSGDIPLLLLHPGSAGHGLNLQYGGRALCFFSDWWDLEKHEQIIERIGPARQSGIGRLAPVLVYQIVARGTLDEAVIERHATKRKTQEVLREYVGKL